MKNGKGERMPRKEFKLDLSGKAYAKFQKLSELDGVTLTTVIQRALGLYETVYPPVLKKGHKLFLVNPRDNSEREIIVPTKK